MGLRGFLRGVIYLAMYERDITMHSKDKDGNVTIDLPITRLGNVEDTADVKETPTDGDYIPIIDSADEGQMKKVPVSAILGDSAKAVEIANAAKEKAEQAASTASTAIQNASAAAEKADAAQSAANEAKASAPAPKSFSIAVNSWTTLSTAKGEYKYSAAITATGITTSDSADVRFDIDSVAACIAAEVAPAAETAANKITVYAKTKPTSAVSGVYTIQKGA